MHSGSLTQLGSLVGEGKLVARIEPRQKNSEPVHTPITVPQSLAELGGHGSHKPHHPAQPGLLPLPRYSAGCKDGLNVRSLTLSYDCSAWRAGSAGSAASAARRKSCINSARLVLRSCAGSVGVRMR
jgi:hypothetical protein